MEKIKRILTKDNLIIFIIMLTSVILSSLFLFDKITYNGVDTAYHISRINGIVNSWKSGDILAFIHLDATGFGYGMGFFYSNLFMILPCLLYLFGLNVMTAYKIFLFMCGLFTAISMYIASKNITKSKYAATISSILYTTCGYRIITMVIKSFAGELLSFIFIPIIIWGLYEIIFADEKKWWLLVIGFVGILNSNLVMTEIMIVVSIAILICNIKKLINNKNKLMSLLKAGIYSLLISALFWMPMIEQLQNNTFVMKEKMQIYQPQKWLLENELMFFGTIQYSKHNLSAGYALGIIFVLILIIRPKIKKQDNIIKYCDISILTALLLLLCMTRFFPWKYLPTLGGMLQFPSRLEIPVAAFLSLASGIICNYISIERRNLRKFILTFIIIWQSIFCIICLKSCINVLIKENAVTTKDEIELKQDFGYDVCDGVYLPEGGKYRVAEIENEDKSRIEREYINYKKDGLSIYLTYNNPKNMYLDVPLFYYYGYVAESTKDKTLYKLERSENGKLRVITGNKTTDTIHIYYKTTNIQKIGLIITGITAISTIVYIVKRKKNGYTKIQKN